jgi:hypothetical protein
MKLSEFKRHINQTSILKFILPDGKPVAAHFHITEVGQITKEFIDCGGTIRKEILVNFQLWLADDLNHRLNPEKLQKIIELSEDKLRIKDAEIEVEYQNETICKYSVEFNGICFELIPKYTNCLAPDQCGVPQNKTKISLSSLQENKNNQCSPGGGCC